MIENVRILELSQVAAGDFLDHSDVELRLFQHVVANSSDCFVCTGPVKNDTLEGLCLWFFVCFASGAFGMPNVAVLEQGWAHQGKHIHTHTY